MSSPTIVSTFSSVASSSINDSIGDLPLGDWTLDQLKTRLASMTEAGYQEIAERIDQQTIANNLTVRAGYTR